MDANYAEVQGQFYYTAQIKLRDSERYNNIKFSHKRLRNQQPKRFASKTNPDWISQTYEEIHADAELARMLQRFPMLRKAKEQGKTDYSFERSADQDSPSRMACRMMLKDHATPPRSDNVSPGSMSKRLFLYSQLRGNNHSKTQMDTQVRQTEQLSAEKLASALSKRSTIIRKIKERQIDKSQLQQSRTSTQHFHNVVLDVYKRSGISLNAVKAEQNFPKDKNQTYQSYKNIPLRSGQFDFKSTSQPFPQDPQKSVLTLNGENNFKKFTTSQKSIGTVKQNFNNTQQNELRSTTFTSFKQLRRQMDKAYLNLKSKGVVLDDKLFKKNMPEQDERGFNISQNETRNRGKILEEAQLYKKISNTFQLLHSNQMQLNAETARPTTEYQKSRESVDHHALQSFMNKQKVKANSKRVR